ncbi:hypothetical protein [Spirosoma foliorum]|uniref:Uncharacterized protein n=1 Tax=Spirosoma foliorum TaxID=2710596 RepID=A0A7G5GRL7_9BACT|nr:hypothetical protein [Spirosoma foliorum]QMW01509.1 hypothetical protein H3H32_26635 [Spirosoma foliorum]
MDSYIFIENAIGHLSDFEENFDEVVADLDPEELHRLADQFNNLLEKWAITEKSEVDIYVHLATESIRLLIQYPKVANILNIQPSIFQQSKGHKLSVKRLSPASLETPFLKTTDLEIQGRLAKQAHRLVNDVYPIITKLCSQLNQKAKS